LPFFPFSTAVGVVPRQFIAAIIPTSGFTETSTTSTNMYCHINLFQFSRKGMREGVSNRTVNYRLQGHCQTLGTAAEIDRTGRDQYKYSRRRRPQSGNHDETAFSTRMRSPRNARSVPGETRSTAAPIAHGEPTIKPPFAGEHTSQARLYWALRVGLPTHTRLQIHRRQPNRRSPRGTDCRHSFAAMGPDAPMQSLPGFALCTDDAESGLMRLSHGAPGDRQGVGGASPPR
jgi:hypothetical protein